MIPGAIEQLEAALDVLIAESVAGVPQADVLVALARVQSRLDAEVARRTEAFRVSKDWTVDGSPTASAWLRIKTRESRAESLRRVRLAKVHELSPLTAQAWQSGEITTDHVDAVLKVARRAKAPAEFAEYEPRLLDVARTCSPEETLEKAREWLQALHDYLDRDGAEKPVVVPESVQEINFSLTTGNIGVINGLFDSEGAALVKRAMDRAHDTLHRANDPRTPARQRADAFVEICKRYLAGMPATGNYPHILLFEELAVQQGLMIGDAVTSDGIRISPVTLDRTLCNSDISIMTTRNGVPLNLGRKQRLFSKHQVRAMTVRDGGCRGPNCDAPASQCEAHHITPWAPDEHGNVGDTDLANGMLGCWHCHRGVHEGGWQVTGDANGTLTFHDREGRLLGTSEPKKPDPKWVTQNGQEVIATRNRVAELLERMYPPQPPEHDSTQEPTNEADSPPDTCDSPERQDHDDGEAAA